MWIFVNNFKSKEKYLDDKKLSNSSVISRVKESNLTVKSYQMH